MQKVIVWVAVLAVSTFSLSTGADTNEYRAPGGPRNSSVSKAEISGQIDIDKDAKQTLRPHGVLYIFARGTGDMMPIAAEVKITDPKFPVDFTITDADRVDVGIPFAGPFNIRACYSSSGRDCDRLAESSDPNHPLAYVGQKDIKILLQTRKEKIRKQKVKRP